MSETILLDPEAITGASRVEVSIATPGSQGAIEVLGDGVDWGDAEIEAIMAKLAVGAMPVDYEIPSRIIRMAVKIQAFGGITFPQARSVLQAKVAQIQADGGWISRHMPDVGTVYADLTNAKLNLPGDWMQAHRDIQIEATLSFEAIPDFYELEWVEAGEITGSAGEAIGVLDGIRGDFPAGNRCRIVVEGDDSHNQLGVKTALRARHYSPDATAALSYQAEALKPLDLATIVTLTGASGGGSNNAVRHNNLSTSWTPVLGLQLANDDYLTHTGAYRIEARVYTTSATPPELRVAYDVGDLVNPAENDNDIKRIPGANNFYLLDLGEIRLDRSPVGDHRWLGRIQARGAAGGENVHVDRVRLWPVDEHYARVATPIRITRGLVGESARDPFKQTAGNLNGKSLDLGGSWATSGASGDFAASGTGIAVRSGGTDSPSYGHLGRIAIAGSVSLADAAVQVETSNDSLGGLIVESGLIARRVNSTNFAFGFVLGAPSACLVGIYKVVSNTETMLVSRTLPFGWSFTALMTMRLVIDSAGRALLYFGRGPQLDEPQVAAYDPVFATGGTLASGGIGMFDTNHSVLSLTRNYDNFSAWVPDSDAAIFAGRSLELTSDGAHRVSPDGLGSGQMVPLGNHPRCPQGAVEVMAAISRGDFDRLPDMALDDPAVRLEYRPCWITAPGAV